MGAPFRPRSTNPASAMSDVPGGTAGELLPRQGVRLPDAESQLRAHSFRQINAQQSGKDRSADDDIRKVHADLLRCSRSASLPHEAPRLLHGLAGLLGQQECRDQHRLVTGSRAVRLGDGIKAWVSDHARTVGGTWTARKGRSLSGKESSRSAVDPQEVRTRRNTTWHRSTQFCRSQH